MNHDNQTNPQTFLMSIQPAFFSTRFFYFISIAFLLTIILLLLYFLKSKSKHNDDQLMNTPSTTTLSNRSISTSGRNKKLYETYHSFGDTLLSPEVIQL
jgi:hypothetical protein